MRGLKRCAVGLGILVAVPTSPAASASYCATLGRQIAEHWSAKEPILGPEVGGHISMATALCAQDAFVAELRRTEGPPVGWKVGLTSKAVQQQLGVSTPVAGRLLLGMLVEDGATVAIPYATRPIVEADLVLRVRSAEINNASTRQDALRGVDALYPFIELPDLMLNPDQPVTASIVAAINVGARVGVLGRPVAVEPTAEWEAGLATMRVALRDRDWKELVSAPGAAILGHPLEALLYLVAELRSRGQALKGGDLVSLGSFGRPVLPQRGQTFTVTYDGLPSGPLVVSVRFQ